ncbi:hypothetical protein HY627_01830 [Candidatus Uhrbacteria bacterium]|nr:hypothetical protein [Candidatus Uhrbacteria bacterium]
MANGKYDDPHNAATPEDGERVEDAGQEEGEPGSTAEVQAEQSAGFLRSLLKKIVDTPKRMLESLSRQGGADAETANQAQAEFAQAGADFEGEAEETIQDLKKGNLSPEEAEARAKEQEERFKARLQGIWTKLNEPIIVDKFGRARKETVAYIQDRYSQEEAHLRSLFDDIAKETDNGTYRALYSIYEMAVQNLDIAREANESMLRSINRFSKFSHDELQWTRDRFDASAASIKAGFSKKLHKEKDAHAKRSADERARRKHAENQAKQGQRTPEQHASELLSKIPDQLARVSTARSLVVERFDAVDGELAGTDWSQRVARLRQEANAEINSAELGLKRAEKLLQEAKQSKNRATIQAENVRGENYIDNARHRVRVITEKVGDMVREYNALPIKPKKKTPEPAASAQQTTEADKVSHGKAEKPPAESTAEPRKQQKKHDAKAQSSTLADEKKDAPNEAEQKTDVPLGHFARAGATLITPELQAMQTAEFESQKKEIRYVLGPEARERYFRVSNALDTLTDAQKKSLDSFSLGIILPAIEIEILRPRLFIHENETTTSHALSELRIAVDYLKSLESAIAKAKMLSPDVPAPDFTDVSAVALSRLADAPPPPPADTPLDIDKEIADLIASIQKRDEARDEAGIATGNRIKKVQGLREKLAKRAHAKATQNSLMADKVLQVTREALLKAREENQSYDAKINALNASHAQELAAERERLQKELADEMAKITARVEELENQLRQQPAPADQPAAATAEMGMPAGEDASPPDTEAAAVAASAPAAEAAQEQAEKAKELSEKEKMAQEKYSEALNAIQEAISALDAQVDDGKTAIRGDREAVLSSVRLSASVVGGSGTYADALGALHAELESCDNLFNKADAASYDQVAEIAEIVAEKAKILETHTHATNLTEIAELLKEREDVLGIFDLMDNKIGEAFENLKDKTPEHETAKEKLQEFLDAIDPLDERLMNGRIKNTRALAWSLSEKLSEYLDSIGEGPSFDLDAIVASDKEAVGDDALGSLARQLRVRLEDTEAELKANFTPEQFALDFESMFKFAEQQLKDAEANISLGENLSAARIDIGLHLKTLAEIEKETQRLLNSESEKEQYGNYESKIKKGYAPHHTEGVDAKGKKTISGRAKHGVKEKWDSFWDEKKIAKESEWIQIRENFLESLSEKYAEAHANAERLRHALAKVDEKFSGETDPKKKLNAETRRREIVKDLEAAGKKERSLHTELTDVYANYAKGLERRNGIAHKAADRMEGLMSPYETRFIAASETHNQLDRDLSDLRARQNNVETEIKALSLEMEKAKLSLDIDREFEFSDQIDELKASSKDMLADIKTRAEEVAALGKGIEKLRPHVSRWQLAKENFVASTNHAPFASMEDLLEGNAPPVPTRVYTAAPRANGDARTPGAAKGSHEAPPAGKRPTDSGGRGGGPEAPKGKEQKQSDERASDAKSEGKRFSIEEIANAFEKDGLEGLSREDLIKALEAAKAKHQKLFENGGITKDAFQPFGRSLNKALFDQGNQRITPGRVKRILALLH